jgi:hypothetical protein
MTKDSWQLIKDGPDSCPDWILKDGQGRILCVFYGEDESESKAMAKPARLASAAPAMLHALRQALPGIIRLYGPQSTLADTMRAAIIQAQGKL